MAAATLSRRSFDTFRIGASPSAPESLASIALTPPKASWTCARLSQVFTEYLIVITELIK
jgi:hypothetical protein